MIVDIKGAILKKQYRYSTKLSHNLKHMLGKIVSILKV